MDHLPVAFQDLTIYEALKLEHWQALLESTGDIGLFEGFELSYELIQRTLVSAPPSTMLIDALEVIASLGTSDGREALTQAAEALGVSLQDDDELTDAELATTVIVLSHTSEVHAGVLRQAQARALRRTHRRTSKEFVVDGAAPRFSVDERSLVELVRAALTASGVNAEHVSAIAFAAAGELHCEIIRGAAVRQVTALKGAQRYPLRFRPALSDHIRYDPRSGRLTIACRSPKAVNVYRKAMGQYLGGGEQLFRTESSCSLHSLQFHGDEVFRHREVGIERIDVTRLRWRGSERDRVEVHGEDCMRILNRLSVRLREGRLDEATFRFTFSDNTKGTARIVVPNKIDVEAGRHEERVLRQLDKMRVRGTFNDSYEHLNLWSAPWSRAEPEWRRALGPAFTALVNSGCLRPTRRLDVEHPQYRGAGNLLQVREMAGPTYIGVAEDLDIVPRTLTPTEVHGYEIDVACCLELLGRRVGATGTPQTIDEGLWKVGVIRLPTAITVTVWSLTREPVAQTQLAIQRARLAGHNVALLPIGASADLGDMPAVECDLLATEHPQLLEDIVTVLQLQQVVEPQHWVAADLVVDEMRRAIWFHRVRVEVAPDSQAYQLATMLVRSRGDRVATKVAGTELSRAAEDPGRVAKQAKARLVAALRKAAPSVSDPIDGNGGYKLLCSSRLIPAG